MAYTYSVNTYRFAAPGPNFTDSTDVKFNYDAQSAASADLKNYPVNHEVLGTELYYTGPFANTRTLTAMATFYNDATGQQIWSGVVTIPTPASQGFESWNWYRCRFWIGHSDSEISKPMRIKINIWAPTSDLSGETKTLYMDVVDTSAPEKAWWEIALEFILGLGILGFAPKFDPLKNIYSFIFDKDLTESEWNVLKLKAADWILPLNALSKLFTGVNLEGNSEAFGSASDYIDLAFGILFILPIAKLPATGAKVLEKAGAEGLLKAGTKAAEKGAAKTTLEALMGTSWLKAVDEMKLNPLKFVGIFKELPEAEMIKVLQTLKVDVAGSLARDVFGKAFNAELLSKAPLWKRIMFDAAKHKWTGFFGLVSLVGAAMGMDTWGNWPLVDNLQFMSGREADDIKAAFLAGTMSKEDALDELDTMLVIANAAKLKIATSYKWNVLQMIFLPMWDDLAALTIKKIQDTIAFIQGTAPPAQTGIIRIIPTPSDAKVSVQGQIPTTGMFEAELPAGNYSATVSKYGYVSQTRNVQSIEGKTQEYYVTLEIEPAPPVLKTTLTISTQPEDADILIAAYPSIVHAGTYDVAPGTYSIKIFKTGYKDYVATFYINEGESKTLSIILALVTPAPPTPPTPPTPPAPPVVPEVPVVVPLEPTEPYVPPVNNAWKYTIHAVDADTQEELYAQLLVDGVSQTGYTPTSIYLLPLSRYVLTVRKKGYKQGVVEIITEALT